MRLLLASSLSNLLKTLTLMLSRNHFSWYERTAFSGTVASFNGMNPSGSIRVHGFTHVREGPSCKSDAMKSSKSSAAGHMGA